jgi:hypothetical protein
MTWRSSALAVSVAAGLCCGATGAHAASLYWKKFAVRTQSEAQCLGFAYGVASRQGLQNIRHTAIEVAGTRGNTYVSITCVGRGGGQNAMAIVMAISDVAADAIAIRDQIAGTLSKTVAFD